MSLRLFICLSVMVACALAQYYSVASAYPYLTGAYAPSPLAGKSISKKIRLFPHKTIFEKQNETEDCIFDDLK